MFVDHHEQHLKGLRKTLATFVTPILFLADIPGEFFSWGGGNLVSRSYLRQENAKLKDEALILRSQLQTLVGLQSENARLRNLLGTEIKRVERKMVAEIIQVDSNRFSMKFLINKGSLHDVYQGQAVIDEYGIVGQVVEVSPTISRVLMITDATHAIPVKVNRNGVRATLQGAGQINQLELRFVPDTTDIKVGDLLLSSGLGQRFPAGYPVAKVTVVEYNPGEDFARIVATPAARLDQSSLVLLVWSDSPLEHR